MKNVAQKMGINENSRVLFIDAPADALAKIKLPEIDLVKRLSGEFDYIHLFVKHQKEMTEKFPALKSHLKLEGILWVSWIKGRQIDTDLSLPKVIQVGYSFGLVESACLSVNEVWSALKFTHHKKRKVFTNSHAKLTSHTIGR